MKKISLALLLALLVSIWPFAAGAATVATYSVGYNGSGVSVTITATAGASTAYFSPIVFVQDSSTAINKRIWDLIKGRWLTSAKTTPAIYPAPTANYDIYVVEKGSTDDFVLSSPTLAIGSDTSAVSTAAMSFVINGVSYYKAAVAAGTEPGNDVIVATKYGAVAFDLGANGTIDAVEATGQAAAQFATEALAIAALPAAASDHVRLGWVTATKSDGAFTFGTTALNVGNSTVAYYSTVYAHDLMGARLTNRSATAAEDVLPANTANDNKYIFIKEPIMIIAVNNAVNSAVFTLELIFN